MKSITALFFSLFFVFSHGQLREKDVTVQKVLKLMGTRFEITVVAPNEEIGYIYIDEAVSEIQRIEKIISSWDETSETSKINKNAGIKPVKVSPELFGLIERAIGISKITDGAFDITYASMDNIWKFDGSMKGAPKEADIKKSIAKIGYKKIVMDPENSTVYLPEVGMRL
ncbi:MAG: FAD:protein FMN transferase, partial [Muricauda sp.]|nr:FAD:protein FMN transferase [Allomuricauda sp.]